jgi:hypothetical protein
MKKVFILLIVLVLSSCNIVLDQYYGMMFKSRKLYYSVDFEDLNTFEDIVNYIDEKTLYDKQDNHEYTNNPEETLITGKGSCGDLSVLFMNIAYFSLGIKMDLVLADCGYRSKAVVNGGFIDHATVYWDDEVIDIYSGTSVEFDKGYQYTFDEVFREVGE